MLSDLQPHHRKVLERLTEHSYHQYLGMRIKSLSAGQAVIAVASDERFENLSHSLHAGVVYSLLDVSCLIALVPMLELEEAAVTSNITLSLLRAIPLNVDVEIHAEVIKKGRQLAFIDASVQYLQDGKSVTAMTGTVTKSIVRV